MSEKNVNNQNKEFTQSARKRSNHQIDMTYGMVEFLLDILGGRENVDMNGKCQLKVAQRGRDAPTVRGYESWLDLMTLRHYVLF